MTDLLPIAQSNFSPSELAAIADLSPIAKQVYVATSLAAYYNIKNSYDVSAPRFPSVREGAVATIRAFAHHVMPFLGHCPTNEYMASIKDTKQDLHQLLLAVANELDALPK